MKICRLAVFMLLVNTLFGQVVINEYSASNLRQFTDNFGKYEDWIELYNKNDKATDISGWYLSDRDTKPKKWQIRYISLIQKRLRPSFFRWLILM